MLHVHRADRADGLVAALGDLLATPQADPLAPEVVAVPTRGMERWLAQTLSGRLGASAGRADGVCANVAFPAPRRLLAEAVAAASGVQADEDPWLPERLTWSLLDVVADCVREPWLRVLAEHLGEGPDGDGDPAARARRLTVLRHLAGLLDRYALERPAMVRAWAAGRDEDAVGAPLPGDARWQAELFRRARERIAVPDLAERVADACARLADDPGLLALPPRVALFGLTRLPAGHLEVLRALAAARDVHLFLLHPSPALWERLAPVAAAARPGPLLRREDPTASAPANPLLAAWARDTRELQLVLGAPGAGAGHEHAVGHDGATLLARLQADVRADRRPPGVPLQGEEDLRPPLHPADRSVQVHACHGRVRQVEVVREAILHLLRSDPTLEPRDVVVLCPDVEAFAPLVHATFGGGGQAAEDEEDDEAGAPPPDARPADLRVRLADRALRQTNPVLGVVAQLLDLADGRLTASQVLDLADREPLRRRFRLDDDDLERLEEWVADSGVRWGLDPEHRAPFGLQGVPSGTWRAGLDRVLVGVAMAEDAGRPFEGVLPLDDVESGAIDLAGRLAELVDRLHGAVDALRAPKPVAAWVEALAGAADALCAAGPRDAWQRAELGRILDDVAGAAQGAGAAAAAQLTLPEVRALLAERLQGRPTRANFRTGHLTVCTLVPMRSVPHRVVCLLGLDDGVFPRAAPRDGDDLVLADPHVGDRDPRSEDRQLLLDALMAARDHLVVTYAGADERTNLERPPAVPVGELLDAVHATARGAARVLRRHPLQPFDPRNFDGDAWSFDRVMLAGARASAGPRAQPGPFLPEPLPELREPVVELDDLVRVVGHPVRAFLRRRLGVSVADHAQELADALPVELDGLERWALGQRMLDARLAGADPRTAYRAEIARGTLPPGVLGARVVKPVLDEVEDVVAAALAVAGDAPPTSADVRVALPDGRTLTGTVAGLAGDVLREVTFSRVGPKHRLAAWVRLLALTAADPERVLRAVTVGRVREERRRSGRSATIAQVPPLGADPATRRAAALAHLGALVDLHDRALREPPPLYCRTSAAYACAAWAREDPDRAARAAWESTFRVPREDADAAHLLVLGAQRPYAALREEPARDDERGPGWDPTEASRLGRWARRLWDGLLAVEEVEDR